MKVKGSGFSIKGSNGTAVAIVAVAVILAGVAMKYGGESKPPNPQPPKPG